MRSVYPWIQLGVSPIANREVNSSNLSGLEI